MTLVDRRLKSAFGNPRWRPERRLRARLLDRVSVTCPGRRHDPAAATHHLCPSHPGDPMIRPDRR